MLESVYQESFIINIMSRKNAYEDKTKFPISNGNENYRQRICISFTNTLAMNNSEENLNSVADSLSFCLYSSNSESFYNPKPSNGAPNNIRKSH